MFLDCYQPSNYYSTHWQPRDRPVNIPNHGTLLGVKKIRVTPIRISSKRICFPIIVHTDVYGHTFSRKGLFKKKKKNLFILCWVGNFEYYFLTLQSVSFRYYRADQMLPLLFHRMIGDSWMRVSGMMAWGPPIFYFIIFFILILLSNIVLIFRAGQFWEFCIRLRERMAWCQF